MGLTMCLAGMGGDVCICPSLVGKCCRQVSLTHKLLDLVGRHFCTLTGVNLGLLEEGREADLEMGRLTISRAARSPMRPWLEFGFQSLSRDSKKQGKLGPNVGARREVLYSCMHEWRKPTGGPRAPPLFANRVRAIWVAGIDRIS